MEPSFYSDQMERLLPQIAAEKDPATKREMRKTYRHLNREFRKATRHRKPWYGLKRNVIVLVLVFVGVVWFCVHVEHVYGWGSASAAFAVGVGVLVLVTVTILFAMKRLSQGTYSEMVKTAMSNFPWMRGRGTPSESKPISSSDKVLDGKTGRTIPALEADAGSKEETNEE